MPVKKDWNCQEGCPVELTMEVIGGRWKSVILYHLLQERTRFGDLKRKIPGITQRMLTLQLRELEQDGLVLRTVYAEVPPRVDYQLTEWGESLRPIIVTMRDWGEQYSEKVLAVRPKAI